MNGKESLINNYPLVLVVCCSVSTTVQRNENLYLLLLLVVITSTPLVVVGWFGHIGSDGSLLLLFGRRRCLKRPLPVEFPGRVMRRRCGTGPKQASFQYRKLRGKLRHIVSDTAECPIEGLAEAQTRVSGDEGALELVGLALQVCEAFESLASAACRRRLPNGVADGRAVLLEQVHESSACQKEPFVAFSQSNLGRIGLQSFSSFAGKLFGERQANVSEHGPLFHGPERHLDATVLR